MNEKVTPERQTRPKCSLICKFNAKYIVTSPMTLREEYRCGVHGKKWLRDSPKYIRPIGTPADFKTMGVVR